MEKNFDTEFGGAVLAGGTSTRMGFNKALIEINGEPMISKIARSLNRAGLMNLKMVGGDSEAFTLLGHECLADEYPGEGPLGGIITALNYFKNRGKKHVLVVACDLPNISPDLISKMIENSMKEPKSVVVPLVEGHLQWMHVLWPTDVLPTLLKSFSNGLRAPWRASKDLPLLRIEGIDPQILFDLDRPEDLKQVL
jgi:molybdopterin-guanine dinucleotide biosynthesis protein A